MYAIKNGLLSRDGTLLGGDLSPNKGGALAPTLLVIHYTGSPSFEGAMRTLCDGRAANRVSAHVLIGEDGKVVQLVPFNRVAWHAGVSEWRGRKGCNGFSVGVEMLNLRASSKRHVHLLRGAERFVAAKHFEKFQ